MRKLMIKIVIVIIVACVGVIYLNHKSVKEEHQKVVKERNHRIAQVLSDESGKYYLVALKFSDTDKTEFYQIYNKEINILSGMYSNQHPSKTELRDFKVNKSPIFILYNTKKEVFRTNSIPKLKLFLNNIEGKIESTTSKVKDAAITNISVHNNVTKESIKIHSIQIKSENNWFVLYQVKDNKGLWVPTGGYYGVEIYRDPNGKLQAIFNKY